MVCVPQQIIWVVVYSQALASGLRAQAFWEQRGEGRGSTRGADSGVISDLESSGFQSQKEFVCVFVCGGHGASWLPRA